MAEEIQKKVLIDVEMHSNEIQRTTERIEQLQSDIAKLQQQQQQLKTDVAEGTITQKQYNQELTNNKLNIKALNSELKDYTRVLENQYKQANLNDRSMNEANASMNEMSAELSKLKAMYRNLTTEERNSEFGQSILQRAGQLNTTLLDLEKEYGQFGRQVGNYEIAGQSLKSALRELTQTMAEMKIQGKDNTEEFKRLSEQASAMKDAMADVNAEISGQASDTANLDALKSSISTISSSVMALNIVLGDTAKENESLQKVLKGLQIALVVINSLTQIQTVAQKQSIVMVKLRTIADKLFNKTKKEQAVTEATATATTTANTTATVSNTVATTAQTTATVAQTTATTSATVAQRLLNLAMKANPVLLIVSGITALIGVLTIFSKKARESQKAEKELNEAIKEGNAELQKSANEGVGEITAKYEILSLQISNAKKKHQDLTPYIQKTNEAFKEQGVQLKNLNDLENFYSNEGKKQFIKAVRERAEVTANMKAYTNAKQKLIELQAEAGLEENDEDLERLEKEINKYANILTTTEAFIKKNIDKINEQTTTTQKATKTTTQAKEKEIITLEKARQKWVELNNTIQEYKKTLEIKEDKTVRNALNKAVREWDKLRKEWGFALWEEEDLDEQVTDMTRIFAQMKEELNELFPNNALTIQIDTDVSAEVELSDKMAKAMENIKKQFSQTSLEILKETINLFSNITQTKMQALEQQAEEDKKLLEKQYNAGLLTQEQYNKATTKLDEDLSKKKTKLLQAQAKRERALSVFQIGIDTASAIMKIWADKSVPTLTAPLLTAMVSALGSLQLANVLAQPLPKAKKGRLIKGKSHQQGGEIIEAEGGEVIINKKSSSMFLPLLSEINKIGGGVAFTQHYDGGYAHRSTSVTDNSISKQLQQLSKDIQQLQIYVSVEDINRGVKKYAEIQERGNF